MPDTNERLFLGEKKKKKYFQHFWHHISEKEGQADVGMWEGSWKWGGGNRIKEREQRSRCGNSGQTVGNATEKF